MTGSRKSCKSWTLSLLFYDLLCTYIDCSDACPWAIRPASSLPCYSWTIFDHFVKERLHIRWYGRYMDDFFLIHPDKEYLQYCRVEIEKHVAKLGLYLNAKTNIFPLKNGLDFLGFHTYLTDTGKVIRKVRRKSKKQ